MAATIARILAAIPDISSWSFTAATAPSATTETPDIEELDLGSAAASANGPARAITLEFADDFDDSVFGVDFWGCNLPTLGGYLISIEQGNAAVFAATATTALTNGVSLPGSPLSAVRGLANLYQSSNKRVREIILQFQRGAGTSLWNQANEEAAPPYLIMEVLRRLKTTTRLRIDGPMLDKIAGHGFKFTDVQLYINRGTTAVPKWHWVEAVKENTIELTESEEHAEWAKDHPQSVYQTARQKLTAELAFQLDVEDPILLPMLNQTSAKRDTTRDLLTYKQSTRNADTIELEMAIRYRTTGGHTVTKRMPRVTLMQDGANTPGSDDYSGVKVKGMVKTNRRGSTIETSVLEVASETVILPLLFQGT